MRNGLILYSHFCCLFRRHSWLHDLHNHQNLLNEHSPYWNINKKILVHLIIVDIFYDSLQFAIFCICWDIKREFSPNLKDIDCSRVFDNLNIPWLLEQYHRIMDKGGLYLIFSCVKVRVFNSLNNFPL